ncbi:hypothetical protein CLV78_105126 [Aliiruegeria haliotis]|uniref:Uncharacterized protein n=1 Tax=Aliiruegeria haliotis TaxID=1280846 RepID=A0A2T0RPF4_9RHOB|nr:hypothetical protein [Aliiruegeria haliotis]PRY23074.1 hypothetical protein CLV78_105126 [Aliiruegeria haliotis]
MRSFLLACATIIAIGIGASFATKEIGMSTLTETAGPSVRIE